MMEAIDRRRGDSGGTGCDGGSRSGRADTQDNLLKKPRGLASLKRPKGGCIWGVHLRGRGRVGLPGGGRDMAGGWLVLGVVGWILVVVAEEGLREGSVIAGGCCLGRRQRAKERRESSFSGVVVRIGGQSAGTHTQRKMYGDTLYVLIFDSKGEMGRRAGFKADDLTRRRGVALCGRRWQDNGWDSYFLLFSSSGVLPLLSKSEVRRKRALGEGG